MPSTEVGVPFEMIVTGILRVVNHHTDIKNYAMSIKRDFEEVVLRSKEKSDNKNSNTTQNVKIISIIEPSKKQRRAIKPENPTMA